MLTFIVVFLALDLLFMVGAVVRYLFKPPRDWAREPWNAKDTAKTAAAAAMAYKLHKDHQEGNGIVSAWMGTSAKEQERQLRFKERYKHLHPDDPRWWS